MSEAFMRKNYCSFVPMDDDAVKSIEKVKLGDVIKIVFTIVRNYENHKRFFAFINVTFDMQEHFTVKLHYWKWLIMKSGYYTRIEVPNKGKTIFIPASISFAAMDEPEFKVLFSTAIDVYVTELGGGMTRQEFLDVLSFA